MPSSSTPEIIIARFLQSNHYNEVPSLPARLRGHAARTLIRISDAGCIPEGGRVARGCRRNRGGRLDDREDPRREEAL